MASSILLFSLLCIFPRQRRNFPLRSSFLFTQIVHGSHQHTLSIAAHPLSKGRGITSSRVLPPFTHCRASWNCSPISSLFIHPSFPLHLVVVERMLLQSDPYAGLPEPDILCSRVLHWTLCAQIAPGARASGHCSIDLSRDSKAVSVATLVRLFAGNVCFLDCISSPSRSHHRFAGDAPLGRHPRRALRWTRPTRFAPFRVVSLAHGVVAKAGPLSRFFLQGPC